MFVGTVLLITKMVRNYQRQTNHGKDRNRSSDSLTAALDKVKSGKLKIGVASRAYGIPETTL